MDGKTDAQMNKMIEAVQPHCDETITAAMTCSQAGSMRSTFLTRIFGVFGGGIAHGELPNPVFIAVGSEHVYAFDYRPRGFKFKIKKEAARWPRRELTVDADQGTAMCRFTLETGSGERHHLEVTTLMGGEKLVRRFLDALGAS